MELNLPGGDEALQKVFLHHPWAIYAQSALVIFSLVANLALIAFSRQAGNGADQIFALAVMAVAASEVCVGLGLVVALHRRRLALDVDALSELRG